MDTYRLLRNNKETGPYSLEQLLQFGLKPYDLLWVDGKSAGWRYSGEINELKEFAPLVEEQPFDRFYKKPEAEKHFHELEKKDEKTETIKIEKQVVLTSTRPPKVYISLPGNQKNKIRKTEIPDVTKPVISIVVKKEDVVESPTNRMFEEMEKNKDVNIYTPKKSAQIPLHVNKFPKKHDLKNFFKYGSAAVYIIVLGVLIYFVARPEKPYKNNISVIEESHSPKNEILNATLNLPDPVQESQTSGIENESESEKIEPEKPLVSTNNSRSADKKIVSHESKEKRNDVVLNTNKETDEPTVSLKTNEENGIRNKSIRGNDVKDETVSTKNIKDLVSVSANDYKRRPFGGIFNLQITVKNTSTFILDNVAVQINYLKPSEQALITNTIHFSSVAPNGSMTIKVPDQLRGIKVSFKIINIESNQYDKTMAGL